MRVVRVIAAVTALAALALPASLAGADRGVYGAKVGFSKGEPIAFPDFTLEYRGEKRVPSPRYKRGFIQHDFVATSGTEKLTVSWSAGTGDIGPSIFTIAHKKFWIELSRSDSQGKLKKNEMVVTYRGPAM